MIAGVVGLTGVEYLIASDITVLSCAVEICRLIFLLGIYWMPVASSASIITLSILCTLFPAQFSIQIWADWLAFGMLGYHQRHIISIILLLAQFVSNQLAVHTYRDAIWESSGVVTLVGSYAMFYIIGLLLIEHQNTVRAQHDKEEKERLQAKYEYLQRDISIASKIHDSTAQGLTLISLLANQCMFDLEHHNNCKDKILHIEQVADETLSDVRRIIDILDSDTIGHTVQHSNQQNTKHSSIDIMNLLAALDSEMYSLDFIGNSSISEEAIKCFNIFPIPLQQEIEALIRQLYTNILKHGQKGADSYFLNIAIENRTLIIHQYNCVTSNPSQSKRLGHGLELHTKLLESFSGSLSSAIEDGIWTIVITIPVPAETA